MVLLMAGAASVARGEVKTEAVTYEHGGQTFAGLLAYDDAAGEGRPGVLVCHEWWGNDAYSRSRAEQLAGLGYVAFSLDVYGAGKVTDDPQLAGAWAGELMGDRAKMRARAERLLSPVRAPSESDSHVLVCASVTM